MAVLGQEHGQDHPSVPSDRISLWKWEPSHWEGTASWSSDRVSTGLTRAPITEDLCLNAAGEQALMFSRQAPTPTCPPRLCHPHQQRIVI